MTFRDRVNRRWIMPVIFVVIGFLVTLVLTFIMLSFALFMMVEMKEESMRATLIIMLFLVSMAFFAGWAFRSMFDLNIDLIVRDMGPLAKKVLSAAITEDLDAESEIARVESPRLTSVSKV
jgi:hypothetical protein